MMQWQVEPILLVPVTSAAGQATIMEHGAWNSGGDATSLISNAMGSACARLSKLVRRRLEKAFAMRRARRNCFGYGY